MLKRSPAWTLKGINLASNMKTLLDRLELSNLWANQDTLTINYNYIKQRIIDKVLHTNLAFQHS